MWHIVIYNKRLYDESGAYLCRVMRPPFYIDDVMVELKALNIQELAIASYELPFDLFGTGWEVLERISNNFSLMLELEKLEGTVLGIKMNELKDYYFRGNIIEFLKGHGRIKLLEAVDYQGAVKELMRKSLIGRRFLLNYFDFEKFLTKEMEIEELKTFGFEYLEKIAERICEGELIEYLDFDALKVDLKRQFKILESEFGFFIDQVALDRYSRDGYGKTKELKIIFSKMILNIENKKECSKVAQIVIRGKDERTGESGKFLINLPMNSVDLFEITGIEINSEELEVIEHDFPFEIPELMWLRDLNRINNLVEDLENDPRLQAIKEVAEEWYGSNVLTALENVKSDIRYRKDVEDYKQLAENYINQYGTGTYVSKFMQQFFDVSAYASFLETQGGCVFAHGYAFYQSKKAREIEN